MVGPNMKDATIYPLRLPRSPKAMMEGYEQPATDAERE